MSRLLKKSSRDFDFSHESSDTELAMETQPHEHNHILATCFNNTSGEGGLFLLKEEKLIPIFNDAGCYGSFFKDEDNLLFCVTRREPQIILFRRKGDKFMQIPIRFENYIFGHDAHGVYVFNGKIFVVAAEGETESEIATNDDHHPGAKVGKIIVSEIEIEKDLAIIKNSKIFNPFSCCHHHHINDIISIDGSLYLSSFSYCDSQKTLVNSGGISKLNLNYGCEMFIDGFSQPHSLKYYHGRLYFCASNMSAVFSLNPIEQGIRIEYKGPSLFIRGLLITTKYFYMGISKSVDRTSNILNDQTSGILQMNNNTGETKLIPLPSDCDNIYSIVSTMKRF